MKTTKAIVLTAALVAALALALASCNRSGGSSSSGTASTGGSSSGGSSSGGAGTLTVTDIPSEYNGKYIAGGSSLGDIGTDNELFMHQGWAGTGEGNFVQISGGRAVIPVWRVYYPTADGGGGIANATRWNGSGTTNVILYIHDGSSGSQTQGYITYKVWFNVEFTNGSATISWDSGR